jgi:hypothetical protein
MLHSNGRIRKKIDFQFTYKKFNDACELRNFLDAHL